MEKNGPNKTDRLKSNQRNRPNKTDPTKQTKPDGPNETDQTERTEQSFQLDDLSNPIAQRIFEKRKWESRSVLAVGRLSFCAPRHWEGISHGERGRIISYIVISGVPKEFVS